MFNTTLAPLQNRDFRFLLTSNFLWWQVRWMEVIVNSWIALELTDSPWKVALIGFFRSVPFLVTGIFSGTIIDRFGRRACSQFAQAGSLIIVTIVAYMLWQDQLVYWHLAVAATGMGTLWSIDWPARRSLIPDLVGKEQTVDAMLLENLAQNMSSIVGPFLSGALLAALGGKGGYTLIALVSGLALAALMGLSRQPIPRTAMPLRSADGEPSSLKRITDGFRYVRQQPTLWGVMWVTLIMNFLAFPYLNILSVFARDVLHQDAFGLGILGSANGVGALVGLFIINRIRDRVGSQWIFAVGSGFFCLMLLLFSMSTSFYLSVGALALAGMGRVCFGVMQSSILLLTATDEMRSRAMGTLTLFIGVGPFGRLQIGGLAEGVGAPLALGLQSSIAIVALAGIMLVLPGYRNPKLVTTNSGVD